MGKSVLTNIDHTWRTPWWSDLAHCHFQWGAWAPITPQGPIPLQEIDWLRDLCWRGRVSSTHVQISGGKIKKEKRKTSSVSPTGRIWSRTDLTVESPTVGNVSLAAVDVSAALLSMAECIVLAQRSAYLLLSRVHLTILDWGYTRCSKLKYLSLLRMLILWLGVIPVSIFAETVMRFNFWFWNDFCTFFVPSCSFFMPFVERESYASMWLVSYISCLCSFLFFFFPWFG